MEAVDYSRLKEDWSAFYFLFSNDKGIRLRLNIPDTVVLEGGRPAAWYYTSREGYVQRQPPGRATLPEVRQHFLSYAAAEGGCGSADADAYCPPRPVAIARLADGLPKLLSRQDFVALCDRLESGQAAEAGDAPVLLQAYVLPFLDLRYITSITNDGLEVSCQTFQRHFSRRYVAFRPPGPLPLPAGTLVGTASAAAAGAVAAAAAAAQAEEEAASPAVDAAGLLDAAAEGADVQLDERVLADMERSLGRTLGPVDPGLKMQVRRAAHGVVQYVQKARGLTLRGLVCEFVRDAAGEVYFLGTLRTDWASLIPGRGGEPWANANLVQPVREEESCSGREESRGLQLYTVEQEPAGSCAVQLAQQGAAGGSDVTIIEERRTSVTIVEPSGQRQTRTMLQRHVRHTPSLAGDPTPSGVSITEVSVPGSDSPRIAALHSPSAATASPVGGSSPGAHHASAEERPGAKVRSPGWQPGSPSQQGTLVKVSLGAAKAANRSPGAPAARSPPAAYGEWHHVNDGRRAPALLTSQLTKELVTLKDDLIAKTELAEVLSAKVEALEHDKHVITDAFDRVVKEMQADLQEVSSRLNALRVERDALAAQLSEAQRALQAAQAERDDCRGRLEGDRSSALTALGEFQRKQEEAVARQAAAEAELKALQEKFREEQVAYDALKKQMVFYQHTLSAAGLKRDGFKDPLPSFRERDRPELAANPALALLRGQNNPEIKFWETLSAVEDLLNREADPDGERYALAKVLHTCQGDLHAIFLYYGLLDASFARHWPPQLTLAGWMAFVKDCAVSNPIPATRTRTDATLAVSEAQEYFRRYCSRQAIITGNPAAGLSHSPSLKAGAKGDPARPSSAASSANMLATGRPTTSAPAPSLAAATLSFEGFCAVLVNVAARLARASPEAMMDNPFLSEQTRTFIEDITTKAQRLTCLAGERTTRRAPGGGAATAGSAKPDRAADKAGTGSGTGSKLPKLKRGTAAAKASPGGTGAGAKPSKEAGAAATAAAAAGPAGQMHRIPEASREGSALASGALSPV